MPTPRIYPEWRELDEARRRRWHRIGLVAYFAAGLGLLAWCVYQVLRAR